MPKTKEGGVNSDFERVEIEPSEPEEGEEVLTPEEESEEKGTLSESPTENKPQESDEDNGGDEDNEDEPKKGERLLSSKKTLPESEEDKGLSDTSGDDTEDEENVKHLPNETPREYALRNETSRLRRIIRQNRTKELLSSNKPEQMTQTQYNELSDSEKQILGQYDPKELGAFENILSVLAKKHGWIRKEELEYTNKTQRSNEVLDDFLQKHKEYLPENDKGNVLWNRFKSEFQLYKMPDNPKDLNKIFNRIHQDIFGVQSEDGIRKINAQQEKIKVASHGGNSAGGGKSSSSKGRLSPELKGHLKGFTEQELEEF
jgi:hypothetical protein